MAEEKNITIGEDEVGIEVDIDSPAEVEVKVETSSPREFVEKKAPATGEDDEEDLSAYRESVRKRIEKLTFKFREAERREQAALDFAKGVKAELEASKHRSSMLDQSLISESGHRLKTQEQLINDRLRTAIDRGDIDTQIAAQKEMASLAIENERLRVATYRREQEVQESRRVPEFVPAPTPVQPDPKAQDWAEKNVWFGVDEPMTYTAFSLHKSLVENEGFDPASEDYYQELDKRIRKEFPHKFQQDQAKRPTTMVASANSTSNAGGQRQVKLTPSQVAIAKRLGVSLKDYARQLQRMNG